MHRNMGELYCIKNLKITMTYEEELGIKLHDLTKYRNLGNNVVCVDINANPVAIEIAGDD